MGRDTFAKQCCGIADVFRRFNAEEAAKYSNLPARQAEFQRQAMDGIRKGVLDGLEKEAARLRRKSAFRGFRRIVEDLEL